MSAVILKIGNADLSMITEQEGVRIRSSPVFSDEFTNVKGVKRRKVLGVQVDLSAELTMVPEAVASAVVTACNADAVSVSYKNPNAVTTVFERPEIEIIPVFAESDDNSYWNISISMTCPLTGSGL